MRKSAAVKTVLYKYAKYADACEAAGVDFRAFVLETFGGCVTNVEEVVHSLATLMSHKTEQ
jgi:hypothetical protein